MRRYFILNLILVTYLSADIKDNINFAGKERMLTQKMSKEALLIARGVDVASNRDRLIESVKLFDRILEALYRGDKRLNIVKTEDSDILKKLDIVKRSWLPFKKNIIEIANGDITKDRLEFIDKYNVYLLKLIDVVVKMYQDRSNIEPHLAQIINLAGKERMLSQKMAKELLLIANNIQSNRNINSLKSSGELFKNTLHRLMQNREHLKDRDLMSRLLHVQNLWFDYQNRLLNTEFTKKSREETKRELDEVTKELTDELLYIAGRIDRELYRSELIKTGNMFNTILEGLIDGNSTLGIVKTKNIKIAKELNIAKEIWDRYRPIIYDGNISKDALNMSLNLNNRLLEQMEKVITLYSNLDK